MKQTFLLLTGLALLTGCVKEVADDPGQDVPGDNMVTIRVSVPEDPYTRVSFTEEDGKLKIAWQENDCLRVISGGHSEVFNISNIISDHVAEFTGPAVEGTSFDIMYPGTYESVEEAEEDTASPVQNGNGSTAHLGFRALLRGVDDYREIAFNQDWAGTHGGSFCQGAAVKMVVVVPDAAAAVRKIGIGFAGRIYNLPLQNVDLTASDRKLTAYMMLPWRDIDLPDGSTVPIFVMDADNEVYSRTLSISGDKKLTQGMMNSFGGKNAISGLTAGDFVSGNGSEGNPYLIANARQLNNMHKSGILVDNAVKYFRLLEDIDAGSISNWVPLNNAGSFAKGIYFDGDGHTITGLRSSDYTSASFAGILNGTIRDVTFDQAVIVHPSSKIGVVGGYIGRDGIVGSCENVHVTRSTVGDGAGWRGIFAGEINTTGTLTGCSVEDSSISGTWHVGGFTSIVNTSPAVLTECYVRGVTVTASGDRENTCAGGFVGCTNVDVAPVFSGCYAEDVVVQAVGSRHYVGGFVGWNGGKTTYSACSVNSGSVSGLSYTGGFVGWSKDRASYVDCKVADEAGCQLTVTGPSCLGGFAGYVQMNIAPSFQSCTVGDVLVNQVATGATSSPTGGFVGQSNVGATFTGCLVKKAVVRATQQPVQDMGGFIGLSGGNVTGEIVAGATFKDCAVLAGTELLNGGDCTGGFVGHIMVSASFNGCSSAAAVEGNAPYHGGFVGFSTGSPVFNNSQASGNVSGTSDTGGFAGYADASVFTNCSYLGGTVSGTSQCGGFVGNASQGLNFRGCYVSARSGMAGLVRGTGDHVGGFAGLLGKPAGGDSNISMAHCFTTASVEGGFVVGGFVGKICQTGVSYCYSAGSISGSSTVGAFGGDCSSASAVISSCIAQHASLPFFASDAGAVVNNWAVVPSGVSTQAGSQGWPESIWNLGGSLPVILASASFRIPAAFMGDSITWQWTRTGSRIAKSTIRSKSGIVMDPLPSYMTDDGDYVIVTFHPGFFSGNGYVNKGISGETTTQMLARFEKDIVALQPEVVVILGGTNDFSRGTGVDNAYNNIRDMAQMAVNGIDGLKAVVICSLTPCNSSCPASAGSSTRGVLIKQLNNRLRTELVPSNPLYAYCDYWSALAEDPVNGLTMDMAYRLYDDLHPGPDGYTVMESVLQPILQGIQ